MLVKDKNYTYQDIIRINQKRKKNLNQCPSHNSEKIKTIMYLDLEKGQVSVKTYRHRTQEIYSIEEFLYKFLTEGFVIGNPAPLLYYCFDNLRLYTNPEEFKKDLTDAANNAALFGMELIFNSFILKPTDDGCDGWEIIGYTDREVASLIIPDFVTSIGDNAFNSFEELRTVRFPNGLQNIGKMAFYGCAKLHEINLPKTLKIIRQRAFEHVKIEKLCMPSVEIIKPFAFCNCNLKGTLRLPENLKKYYVSAFGINDIETFYTPKGAVFVQDVNITHKVIRY